MFTRPIHSLSWNFKPTKRNESAWERLQPEVPSDDRSLNEFFKLFFTQKLFEWKNFRDNELRQWRQFFFTSFSLFLLQLLYQKLMPNFKGKTKVMSSAVGEDVWSNFHVSGMFSIGSHHHQVAIMVLDDKLDCFGKLEKKFTWSKMV